MTSPHWGAVVPGTLKRQRWREPPPPPRAGPWERDGSGYRHSQAGTGLVGACTVLCRVLVDGLVLCRYLHQGKANTTTGTPSLRVPCPGGVARPTDQPRSRRTHHPYAGVACMEQAGQSLLWVELAARVVGSKCRKRVLHIGGGGCLGQLRGPQQSGRVEGVEQAYLRSLLL